MPLSQGLSLKLGRLAATLVVVNNDLWKRLGARLLVERRQVRDWNESEAAREAGIQPKTVRRIELGENYEIASLEKYARALGRPVAGWLVEVLNPSDPKETQRALPSSAATVGSSFPSDYAGPDRREHDAGPPPGMSDRRSSSSHR